jgi:glycosyltransferase involved in cell wall biosynthesis
MRILWVGTKPPWPPTDGGRLVATSTIQALTASGHEVTVVAPFAPSRDDAEAAAASMRGWCEPVLVAATPRGMAPAVILSALQGRPISIVRHALDRVGRRVAERLAAGAFDVVHAEQPQALAQCVAAFERGIPVVLRAQNVESDLWAAVSAVRPVRGALARMEAARMARFEGEAVRSAQATVALTARDAERLRRLSGAPGRVHHVPVPFSSSLPAADEPLPGAPPIVLLGSGGWMPNQEGSLWFVREVWPEVRQALPGAVLHVFGDALQHTAADVTRHAAPADSREAFAPGAVMVVPVTFGSGVRMKILEAWARGLPVVATPAAAEGLEAEDGRDLLLVRNASEFVVALQRLRRDPGLAASLVAAGRDRLAAGHAPVSVASRLVAVYEAAGRPTPTP